MKITYSPFSKSFENQVKAIEGQGEKPVKAVDEHGKQLVKYSDEKESLTHFKQKNIFEEIANRRMEEIHDLSKQTVLII